jgi:BirA family transcriptional regulator, biotin operon repressor / biotin---[acetyl-CoA-carboxylase] ligase
LYNITPKTLFIGRKVLFLPTCHSTNDIAASLIKEGEVLEGLIVITSDQTRGRGQRGNQWEAEAGKNLTFSLVLKPAFITANDQFQLNIAISLGIHDFLSVHFPKEVIKIKWPNDIYHKDRKLGGVLIENALKKYDIETSVIGIGLNVNQTAFANKKAVSMKMASGQSQDYNLEELLVILAESLERNYMLLKNGRQAMMKERYLQNLYRYQTTHCFRQADQIFEGQIEDVDASGRLVVLTNGSLRYFNLKEIEFIE